ncbi:glycoside hydrolase family 75 protein [Streptomyces bluensis]|uniref:Glycoside hydrolase family 75 protein n=1 Tax=Streptomyces bluensis TaxID=33897 RepID=A0ABW6UCW8_9ACTN
MRAQSLVPAAAGTTLLAFTTVSAAAHPREPVVVERAGAVSHGSHGSSASRVSAADLLAKLDACEPVSKGRYRSDVDAPDGIPVCDTRDAVFWKADMDIDCDGRPGPRCNDTTDPWFRPSTAYRQSDGRYLNAETLPFVVIPAPSHIWDHRAHDVGEGSVAAVIHGDRVQYAVVGDVGPHRLIGEASYAMATSLGLRGDPRSGGAPSGVTYVVFKNSRVTPIEDHEEAVAQGEALARKLVSKE